MTNRQKFFQKTNEYDLMLRMQKNAHGACPISIITGDFAKDCEQQESCEQCIQQWLNEEVQW